MGASVGNCELGGVSAAVCLEGAQPANGTHSDSGCAASLRVRLPLDPRIASNPRYRIRVDCAQNSLDFLKLVPDCEPIVDHGHDDEMRLARIGRNICWMVANGCNMFGRPRFCSCSPSDVVVLVSPGSPTRNQ